MLVIGGGATGTGVLRDLAMRGFDAVLVEKRDLNHGTTGRYHGLLHSGARYVVKDPAAAVECIEENRILRRIMPHCIEDTGGFFVLTPWDDPDYVPRFLDGCRRAGIPVEEVEPKDMLAEEPALNPAISRCFRVPDAAADSFLATEANAASAREYGAQVHTYHEVVALLRDGDRVVGARCRDLVGGDEVEFLADLVVNATGAWAGKIAALAGVEVPMRPGRGVMVAVNHRVVDTVINRCKMPDDGDIIVPIQTVAVIGTTDVEAEDPDRLAVEPDEVRFLLDEGEKLVPGLSRLRMLRAWVGARPLYSEGDAASTRDISRDYALLDHQVRDGVEGFVTITGGKWTTYRRMAESTVDLVCRKLGVERDCRTHLEELPEVPTQPGVLPTRRLAAVEEDEAYGRLVCECELVTVDQVARSLAGGAATVDDVRRDTRLGMGPCQGGFCLPRVVGLIHRMRGGDPAAANAAFRDFLAERWKGVAPLLWGDQLRQQTFDEMLHLEVAAVDLLEGPTHTELGRPG